MDKGVHDEREEKGGGEVSWQVGPKKGKEEGDDAEGDERESEARTEQEARRGGEVNLEIMKPSYQDIKDSMGDSAL